MNYCIKYNTFTKQSFISLLLVFGIIFLSDDCLLFSTNENKIFFYAKFIYIFAITSIMFIYDLLNQKQFEKKTMSFCFLMILISFLNIIATQDFLFGNFCRICLFVYSLCLIRRLSINTFFQAYDTIMFFLCIASLVFYLCTFILPDLITSFPLVTNTANMSYYSIGIYNTRVISDFRNYGFAREPGVFQAFIVIALLYQISKGSHLNNKKLFLYTTTLITTFSTTAFFALFFCLLVYLFQSSISKKKKVYLFVILSLTICFLAFYLDFLTYLNIRVFNKLENVNAHTTLSRIASIVVNIYIFLQHPIFGAGIQNVSEQYSEISQSIMGLYDGSNTNSIFFQFSSQGLFYGLLWTTPLLLFTRKLFKNKVTIVMSSLILIILCFGENFTYSGLFYLLIFFSLKSEYSLFVKNGK